MSLANYNALQTAIMAWLNRLGDTDVSASVPDMIVLVEARLRRLLRTKKVTYSTALVLDSAAVTLPADVKEPRAVILDDSIYKGPLEIVSPTRLAELRAFSPTTGIPVYAAVIDDKLHLVPAPQTAYASIFMYEPEVLPLATNSTNWVLTNHPDVYLYGALVEASPYMRDDPRVSTFEPRFKDALAELELARDRSEYPNTPIMRPKRTLG